MKLSTYACSFIRSGAPALVVLAIAAGCAAPASPSPVNGTVRQNGQFLLRLQTLPPSQRLAFIESHRLEFARANQSADPAQSSQARSLLESAIKQ